MTTHIKITNEGPENAGVMYYDQGRQFKDRKELLKPGESIQVTVWDGNIPVVIAMGDKVAVGNKFHSVPPCGF